MTTSPWHKVGHTQRSKNVQSYEALKSSAGLHEVKKYTFQNNFLCCSCQEFLLLFHDADVNIVYRPMEYFQWLTI